MKQDWPLRPLGEVCEIKGGGTPSKDEKSFYQGSIPWATVRDMKGEIISSTECMITEEAVAKSSTNIIPANNVVIATRVGLGKVCLIHQDTAINQDLRGVLPKNEKILLVRYLFWWLKSVSHKIEEAGTGATVKGVKLPFVKSLLIPVPERTEQQRIVAILDEAFAGIATATANAVKNLQNARELFESTLQSVFAEKGGGWKEKTLREVSLEFGRGKSKHRPRNDKRLFGGKYPFVQTGDVRNSNGQVIKAYTTTYNELGLAQSKLWPKGTICITIAANIAETGILGFDACFPDSVIGMVVDKKKTNNQFVEYLLQSFKAVLKAKGKGSAQNNINLRTFENQNFPFPELKVQDRIVEKLDSLSEEMQKLEIVYIQKLDELAELKQSILQKAFAGELH